MTSAEDVVRDAVRRYAEIEPENRRVTQGFVARLTGLLDDAGINYLTVTGRAKSLASFAQKAARLDGDRPLFADPLRDIGDQIGVRVITYVQRDVDAVANVLADVAVVLDDRDMGVETARQGLFGYVSRHLQIRIDDPADELGGHLIQVQIRTVLQHAWAEFEHDIRYKGSLPGEHAWDLDRRFTLAAGLLELADREFSEIRDRLQPLLQPRDDDVEGDPRISAPELAAFLAGQYPDAGFSRTDHYAWISGLLLELGITGYGELSQVCGAVDDAELSARMGYRHTPSAVRRLDDALLWSFGERYVGLHGNAHRVDLLRTRWAKMQHTTTS